MELKRKFELPRTVLPVTGYLDADQRAQIKSIGGKWDKEEKVWYVEAENFILPDNFFATVKTDVRTYCDPFTASYDKRSLLKSLGATFDGEKKRWYFSVPAEELTPEQKQFCIPSFREKTVRLCTLADVVNFLNASEENYLAVRKLIG